LVKVDPIKNMIADASRARNIPVRFITEINETNMAACKELMGFVELRHLDGVRGNFLVTEQEYYTFTGLAGSDLPSQTIHSDLAPIVEQQQYLFDVLWTKSIPAIERIEEVRFGLTHPKIDVLQNPREIQQLFLELIRSAKKEIIFVFPTANAFRREGTLGIIDLVERKAVAGLKVRILIPRDQQIEMRIKEGRERLPAGHGVDYREIERPYLPNTVTILVVDNSTSFVLEQKDDTQEYFTHAVGMATHSTSQPNVVSHILFFETLWRESELREKETIARTEQERAKHRSQLLQDILTHDMRNYNQSLLLDAESLGCMAADSEFVRGISRSMVATLDRSSTLIDRAMRLGKIVEQKNIDLKPVGLGDSIERSIRLIQKANPDKSLDVSPNVKPRISVMADELLDEVFVNLFSNAVKYTKGRAQVPVEITVEETKIMRNTQDHASSILSDSPPVGIGYEKYWKITIADHGIGMPDTIKRTAFTRYLESAKGAGLGLSIVHALVVERYGGSIHISDRVAGDTEQGAKIEIWLRQP
jgi:signal transduction histidine kinase